MGWPINRGSSESVTCSEDFEWYKGAAVQADYGKGWYSVRDFAERAKIADLVWFRHPNGRYFIAELTGQWQYRNEADHIPADIVNFRTARIVDVGLADSVPGKVISAFIRGRTFQPIRAAGMLKFAGEVAGTKVDEAISGDLLDHLSATDIEDLVAVYLQKNDWIVLPSTRMPTTPHYEFVLAHRVTGARSILQVKSGATPLPASDYASDVQTFLFAACGQYGDLIPPNVEIVIWAEVRAMMMGEQHLLPDATKRWISICGMPPE